MGFLLAMMKLGLANLWLHRLRSFLTALGIILGIGAVITMVSIGEGSKREALAQLERLGAKNIIIRSQRPPESAEAGGGQRRGFVQKYGLTRVDLKNLSDSFPDAEAIVPLKAVGGQILIDNRRRVSQAFGTTPTMLDVAKLRVARGRYLSQEDLDQQAMVCVVGSELAKEMFPFEDPLGSTLRVDRVAFRIVGVLAPVGLAGGAGASLVGRDLNLDLHMPITTASATLGDRVIRRESGTVNAGEVQISEIYLAAPDRESVMTYSMLVRRLLEVRPGALTDVGIIVPYELLEQAKSVARRANFVLGAIASISLLVGGIGIMNIMLASVTERTREIGIRRALGATRKHITWQFLVETGVLSTLGGIIGVGLGIGCSVLIGHLVSNLPTNITLWSILVAFAVAAATGLVFGLYPAMKAAKQDPIVALRHD
jgi:putative ABC transport system permease protein